MKYRIPLSILLILLVFPLLLFGCSKQGESKSNISLPLMTSKEEIKENLSNLSKTLEPAVVNASNEVIQGPSLLADNITTNSDDTASSSETDQQPGIILVHKTLTGDDPSLTVGKYGYLLTLQDVALDSSAPTGACALLALKFGETNNSLIQLRVCKDTDYLWTSPEGRKFRIRVLGAGVGYSTRAIFAEVAVFEPQ